MKAQQGLRTLRFTGSVSFWDTLAVPVVVPHCSFSCLEAVAPRAESMLEGMVRTFSTLAGRSHSVARSFLLLKSYKRLGTLLQVKK